MQHTADADLESRHQLRQTAFHEAGHAVAAVAAFALGRHSDVMELSVIPDDKGWGHVLIRNIDDGKPSRWRGRFVGHEVMILLAGNVAQDIFDYSANRREIAPRYCDWKRAVALATLSLEDEDQAAAYVESLWKPTRSLLLREGRWFGVEAVARALAGCRQMSGALAWEVYGGVVPTDPRW